VRLPVPASHFHRARESALVLLFQIRRRAHITIDGLNKLPQIFQGRQNIDIRLTAFLQQRWEILLGIVERYVWRNETKSLSRINLDELANSPAKHRANKVFASRTTI
jgi:hypothetical protein